MKSNVFKHIGSLFRLSFAGWPSEKLYLLPYISSENMFCILQHQWTQDIVHDTAHQIKPILYLIKTLTTHIEKMLKSIYLNHLYLSVFEKVLWMEQLKDEELVSAFRDGNIEAFEELVLRHRNRVYNTIRNIIHDDELAWDGAQETFIKVYQKIDTYRGKCPVGAWIYRIAMNHGLNMLRKRKRIKEEVCFDEAYMQGEKSDNPFETLTKTEFDNEELSYAIEQLPKTQKAIVILRHFSQLSFKEIAETLNKNEDSVKSNHYYAIMKLRTKLVKDDVL